MSLTSTDWLSRARAKLDAAEGIMITSPADSIQLAMESLEIGIKALLVENADFTQKDYHHNKTRLLERVRPFISASDFSKLQEHVAEAEKVTARNGADIVCMTKQTAEQAYPRSCDFTPFDAGRTINAAKAGLTVVEKYIT